MEPTTVAEQEHKVVELVTFSLGGSMYGIDILKVHEINKIREWTPVPEADDFVKGILSLRGSMVTILDLSRKLGLAATEVTEHSRNVIVNSEGHCVGFLVDRIGSITYAHEDQLCEPPADTQGVHARYLKGILQTETDPVAILDVDEVFGGMEQTKHEPR